MNAGVPINVNVNGWAAERPYSQEQPMKKINVSEQRAAQPEQKSGGAYPEPLATALAGREQSGPRALHARYPRIVERLAGLWGDKEAFDTYVGELVFNQRSDERKGFDPEVIQDIFFMKELRDSIKPVQQPVEEAAAEGEEREQEAPPGAEGGERRDGLGKEAWRERDQRDQRERRDRREPALASGAEDGAAKREESPWVMESELMRVKAKMEMRRLGQTKGAASKIGEVLRERGCLGEEGLLAALELQASGQKRELLGSILSSAGLASDADIQRALCAQQGAQLLDLDKMSLDPAVAGKIPRDIERSKKIIAVAQNARTILVASANPIDFAELDWLGFFLGTPVEMAWASAGSIERKLSGAAAEGRDKQGSAAGEAFKKIAKAAAKPLAERKARMAAVFELTKKGPAGAEDATIGDMVRRMLADARSLGASDIHIEAGSKSAHSIIRMRIDGVLSDYAHFDKAAHDAVVSHIKVSAEMDIAERRRPQEGKLTSTDALEGRIEARVSSIPCVGGCEAITLRLINAAEPLPLARLGADEGQKRQLDVLLSSPHGLLLVCGPTGSGKTTTLHSMLAQLNTPSRKIWTVEDPVEILQDGLVQTQAQPKVGYGFDAALRAFMRADPDVIMVGEVRDSATASAVLEASLTGHFVLTTLHTNSACETAVRMLDLGADPFAFSDAIRGIVAQRLARKLCSCSVARPTRPQELDEMAREHFVAMGDPGGSRAERNRWLAEMGRHHGGEAQTRVAVGCEACRGTGHRGRVGVMEVLAASPELKKALANKAGSAELLGIALGQGFRPLRARAIELACEGTISLSEARAISL